ncbi:MAG: histone deacetylase, partial [Gammaproteobacteria bacterium]|nr:histone deacetylase [Gammaproteobacteria bacterium]
LQFWLVEGHPESPDRLRSIMKLMQDSGLLSQLTKIELKNDILVDLARIHTAAHTHALKTNDEKSNNVALAVVGGILAATDEVCSGRLRNAFCATRPPGHHARNTGRVEGFCFYNGVAVAARYAQEKYGLKKILIVDWDYHHGDGTESFFYSDPSVLYFSTHDYFAYPGTGSPSKTGEGAGKGLNINVHLSCKSTDKDIIAAFNEKLLPAAHRFKPDLILISAGFDSRQDDLLGCFDISDEGYRHITKMVMQLAEQYCDGRIVSVLEGGYYLDGLASAVKIHVETLQNEDI